MSELPAIKYLDMAAKAAKCVDWGDAKNDASGIAIDSIIALARTLEEADRLREALAKHEPEPVDPDRAAFFRIYGKLRGGETATYISANVEKALAQYKAERPTITDNEALLIAREIAASFADYWGAKMARRGSYDGSDAQKFALAMVKRDPAALEAFRGVGRG